MRHYGLTNQMEFFAEMTESYFGVNDFFPFNRAELKEAEPEIYALLRDIWEAPPVDRSLKTSPTLQQQLLKEDAASLARAAREQGDPSRGAIVFHRPDLVCTRCHTAGEDGPHLGPDLAKVGKEATDVYLVESILLPSKVIKKGFETVIITTKAGKTVTGLLAEERADAVVLRDAAQDGKLITILKKDIDERNDKGPSLMPEGLVNVLSGRQEFLDLTRYLMEIAEKGPERAGNCAPPRRCSPRRRCRTTSATSTTPASSAPSIGRASSAARRSTLACAPTATARRSKPAPCRPRCASPRASSRTAPTRFACTRR